MAQEVCLTITFGRASVRRETAERQQVITPRRIADIFRPYSFTANHAFSIRDQAPFRRSLVNDGLEFDQVPSRKIFEARHTECGQIDSYIVAQHGTSPG